MGGGKETPRQKMIGMMYLVLTALLAMNVSKEIINAFVTLNHKLETGNEILHAKNKGKLGEFEAAIAVLSGTGAPKDEIAAVQVWYDRAIQVENWTKSISNHFMKEAGEMIKEADGVQFTEEDGEGWIHLKDLMEVQKKDDYDIATRLFGGEDAKHPAPRGKALIDSIKSYRTRVVNLMANYSVGEKQYSWEAPDLVKKDGEDKKYYGELKTSLEGGNVNVEDTAAIARVYKQLTDIIPETEKNHDEMLPWTMSKFDHSPIVAAAAIFTSLKTDVLQAQSMALDHLASKVHVQTFDFNKIEPLAFASTGYINVGDSLDLSVMIAAYDSTEKMKIKYWVDDSTKSGEPLLFEGEAGQRLTLSGGVGAHVIDGQIAVKEKGVEKWKPWRFAYKVGAPTSAIGNAEMTVMYVGYDNLISASASGYSEVSVSCSGCASFGPSGKDLYKARVSRPGQTVKVNVSGVNKDGKTEAVASQDFLVLAMPKPSVFIAGTDPGKSKIPRTTLAGGFLQAKLIGSPLKIKAAVTGGIVKITVGGFSKPFPFSGGQMPSSAASIIRNMTPGSTVTVQPKVTLAGAPVSVGAISYEVM